MIPRTISASSLSIAEQCLAHFKASSIDRGSGFQNDAARLGTTLHAAFEEWTEPMTRGSKEWEWTALLECYNKAFGEVFGPSGSKEWYDEGRNILQKWYNRPDMQSDLQDVEILSREVKESFMVPYVDAMGQKGEVQFNYIIDRLDKLDDGVYRVVDYKSQRSPLNPDDLKLKIQPRAYALATQIKYPDAKEIWVQYDFLRYERVGALFTRDDQVETWKYLKALLQKIVNTPDASPPETLNEGCRFCVRKYTCNALQTNIRVGGIFSLGIDQIALTYHELKSQMDALKSVAEDFEHQLLQHAVNEDLLEWDHPQYKAKVTSYKKRVVDRDMMATIIGPELMAEYGRLNVSDIDALRKDPRLEPARKSLLDTAISYKHSDPSIKVTKKS